MNFWQIMLANIVTPAVVIGAITWIMRGFFDRALDRDLARYKNELETQRLEYLTRASLFHKKQSEVIGIIYGRLARASRLLLDLTHPLQTGEQSLPEKREHTQFACEKADNYFTEHRIYLDDDLRERIEKILETLKDVLFKFIVAQSGEKYVHGVAEEWMESYKKVKQDVPPLLQELERRFRQQIRVDEVGKDQAAKRLS